MNLPSSAYEWKYRLEGNTKGYPLLWLHGFMGAGDDWLELVQPHFSDYCNILIDLPGHGKSRIPTEATFVKMLSALPGQLSKSGIEKYTPIGYSMGGRIGFHLHILAPEKIPALIFLSSAPGLKTRNEREQRTHDDVLLMDKLDSTGVSPFLQEWYSSDLFGEIKNNSTLFRALCHKRSNNDSSQMRQALTLMGNGALPSQWDNLEDISVPTLLMTGELDSKYFQLNQEMNQIIPGSIHQQVSDAGHAFHLEKPLETARIIRHFLSEIIEGE
ncbi:MAG: 2-succinyl-6-hydroxy-2,4-cyclohexadiene-1-carboxylate synthase [Candidatus Marinimicrobia bacterium]|nr:2-succinyl-6-hydroxy-2,4-cyclohexadiene-1-carboxylate synthase [Candidatus Neomarinimicrobiota bacterium]MBT3574549.1 2-succinyl-6-hydroxy-2,4-cyclohexadiene-1-carboxylate synthase [Candidatus Neomarinimicrobiota bacterium]MBT3680483.1 2-succinyl-6-hydroxy-2,4-cyclohexadiene-1-carboxylate synthase [Candidatus Neomarinimicrobiota bacterium]MBT3951219.1 2-succinyl-6-hydroxy-2,4-cyclohexadiene-1-carboxylate synthase [Candidatus Neomarinimicrobiota bacterium]MBT4253012.1 2-succinyl-6-hydroxy-2,4